MTIRLILAGVSTSIGLSIPVGYCIGNINAPSKILKQWCNTSISDHYDTSLNYNTLNVVWSSVVSIFLVGGMIGSFCGAWLSDKFGRKGASIITGALFLTASVLFFICKSTNAIEILLVARLLSGLASGLTTAVVPMFLIECFPESLASFAGLLCPIALCFGVVVGQAMSFTNVLGTTDDWHLLLSGYVVLVIIGGIFIPFLEESPKYLYSAKKDKKGAIRAMTRLRKITPEGAAKELAHSDKQTSEEAWSVWKLLTTKSQLLNVAIVCALQAGQQVSGINAIMYYSMDIFASAGLPESISEYSTLLAGFTSFLMVTVMTPVVNNNPHRFLAILSCFLTTILLSFLALSIALQDKIHWMSYCSILGVLGYITVCCLGLGPIPYFIASELFDDGPRAAAMALGSLANWGGNFFIGMAFPSLQSSIGYYSFLIFAGCIGLLTVFLIFCMPETNAKILAKRQASASVVKK